jgi:murein DD-endopeptidase MepM/ murein hydrolase activator NlpD
MGTVFDMAKVMADADAYAAQLHERDRRREEAKRQQQMEQMKFSDALQGSRFDRFNKLYDSGVPATAAGSVTGYRANGLPDVSPAFTQKQQEWSAKTTLSPADEDKQATDLLQHLLDKNHPYDQALDLVGSVFPGFKSRRSGLDPSHFKGYGPPPKPKLTLDKLLSLREQAKAHYLAQRYSGPEAAQMAENDVPMSLLDTGDAAPGSASPSPPPLPIGNRDTEAGSPVHPVISALLRAAQSAKTNASPSFPASPSGPPQMEPNAILDDKIGQWNKLNAEYRTTTDPVRKAQLSRGMDDLSVRIHQIKSGQPLHPTTPMGETERRRIEDQARYQQGQLQNAADRNAETGRKNRVDELQHALRLDMEQSRAEAQTAQGWARLNEGQRHHLADEWTRKYGIDQRIFQGTMKSKSGEGLKPGERATLMRLPLEDWLNADHRALLKKWDGEDKTDLQAVNSPALTPPQKQAAQDRINLRSTWRTNLLRVGEKKRNAVLSGYQEQRGAVPGKGANGSADWPTTGTTITSGFGSPRSTGPHQGLDIDAKMGDPVFASAPGQVVEVGHNPILGNFVVVDHGQGYQTVYGHLSKASAHQGQLVQGGAVIGAVGNTGRVYPGPGGDGSHLHFAVRKNGKLIDPRLFLGGANPSHPATNTLGLSAKETRFTTSRPGGPHTPLAGRKTGAPSSRRKAQPGVNDYLSGLLK